MEQPPNDIFIKDTEARFGITVKGQAQLLPDFGAFPQNFMKY